MLVGNGKLSAKAHCQKTAQSSKLDSLVCDRGRTIMKKLVERLELVPCAVLLRSRALIRFGHTFVCINVSPSACTKANDLMMLDSTERWVYNSVKI